MKKSFTTLLLVVTFFYSFAQTNSIDSLKKVIQNSKVDTAKIDAYIKAANYYENKSIDSAIFFSTEGIQFCIEKKHKKGQVILMQIQAISYAKTGDLIKAKQIFEATSKLAIKHEFIGEQINTMNNLAILHTFLHHKDSSKLYFNKVLELSLGLNDSRKISAAYNNLGLLEKKRNNYYTAIEYFQKADNVIDSHKIKSEFDKTDIIRTKANANHNIGLCFLELKNNVKAIQQYKISMKAYKSIGDSSGISRSFSNIGAAFVHLNIIDSAQYYIRKSMALSSSTGMRREIATDYYNLGEIYYQKEKYDSALIFLEKAATEYNKKRKDKAVKAYYGMAEVYLALKKHTKAEHYLDSAMSLASDAVDLKNIYKIGLQMYEAKGEFKKALSYADKLIQVKDSLYDTKKTSLVYDLQTKYETEKKEQLAKQLTLENKLKTAENKKLKSRQTSMLSGFALLVLGIVVFVMILRKRQNERQNRLRFEEIGLNNERIASSLHNNVKNYNTAVKMRIEDKQTLVKEVELLDTAITELDYQIRLLHAPDVFNKNFDFVAETTAFANYMQNLGTFKIDLKIDDTLNASRYKEIQVHLFNITKELLTNTLKYANADLVEIRISQTGKNIEFSYTDNGIGFDTEQAINSPKKQGGYGLKNIVKRVERMNAEMNISSENGMNFALSIPTKAKLLTLN